MLATNRLAQAKTNIIGLGRKFRFTPLNLKRAPHAWKKIHAHSCNSMRSLKIKEGPPRNPKLDDPGQERQLSTNGTTAGELELMDGSADSKADGVSACRAQSRCMGFSTGIK